VIGFFKTGSRELFAWAGFEPWSSWVGRIAGVSHWCLANFFSCGFFFVLLICLHEIEEDLEKIEFRKEFDSPSFHSLIY
jgi:hypothetical protein